MISIAIVEDNADEASILEKHLKRYSVESDEPVTMERFDSGFQFIDGYTARYDVVFMDIEMPGMDGMTTARKLREIDTKVFLIFITRMAKYAVSGYKVDAMDYFLKPVHYSDIRMRMGRIRHSKEKESIVLNIPVQGGIQRLQTDDLLYVESIGHDLYLHTTKKKSPILYRGSSMKKMEEELEKAGFFRCNTSYIVNLKYCREIKGFTVTIGDEELQISRPRKKDFMAALMSSFRL